MLKVASSLDIGTALTEIRKKAGFSQEDLKAATGFTIGYISRLEGNKKGASLKTLEIIAGAYNIPPSFIIILAETHTGKYQEDVIQLKEAVRNYMQEKFNY